MHESIGRGTAALRTPGIATQDKLWTLRFRQAYRPTFSSTGKMPHETTPSFVPSLPLPVPVSSRPVQRRLYPRTATGAGVHSVRACACRPCPEAPSETSASSSASASTRRPGKSDATRYKISAAMKGRRISASHRSKISASLSGENNPRYGRRLTDETRARISAGVAAAAAARRAATGAATGADEDPSASASMPEQPNSNITERALRTKALSSPLLNNGRSRRYDADDDAVDALMQRVRTGGLPPDAVLKKYVQLKRVRTQPKPPIRQDVRCTHCNGTGMNSCASCVGAFGTVSERCGTCLGSGAVYCAQCGGTGAGQ